MVSERGTFPFEIGMKRFLILKCFGCFTCEWDLKKFDFYTSIKCYLIT